MYNRTSTCMKVNDARTVNRDIYKPFLLPQKPYYSSQLSAALRKIPQKCLNVKALTFPMATNRAKSFLKTRFGTLAARFGSVVLSVIIA